MWDLLVECRDASGQTLRQPDGKLHMRSTIGALLKLANSVGARQLVMNPLKPITHHEVWVVGGGVVQGAKEAHSFAELGGHFGYLITRQASDLL